MANSVAIGAGTTTNIAGTKQTSITFNNVTYNWAGGANTETGDIVSIGSNGYERQLKSVAAGEVSATSTDAINGSQLYEVLSTSAWNIGNNAGTAVGDGLVAGDQVNFKNGTGTTATVTPGTADATGNIPSYDVKYNVNTDGTTIKIDGSGNVAVNTSPLTVNNSGVVSATTPGAIATAGSVAQAINDSQLTTVVQKGTNIASVDSNTVDKTTTYTINANGAAVVAGANTHVSSVTDGATHVTAYTVNADKTTVSAKAAGADGFGVTVTGTPTTDATTGTVSTDYAVDLNAATKQAITTNTTNLSNLTTTVNAGWEAQVNGTKVKDVTPTSKTLNFVAGSHMTVTGSGNDITIAAADDVVTTATDKYITGGSASYQPNGTGSAALTGANGAGGTVTGLQNYYVTTATVGTDGKTVTLTRNDGTTIPFDLTNTIKAATDTAATNDYKLVANPATGSGGIYQVNADGSLALTVANDTGDEKTVTIRNIATKADGFTYTGNTGTTGLKALGSTLAVTGTSGITTTASDTGIVIGMDTPAVINNINNATGTPVTNISANFGVTAESGTQKTVTLAQGTTPTIKFEGDGSLIKSEMTDNGVKYSVDTTALTDVINNNSSVSTGWEAQVNGTKVKDVTPTSKTLNFVAGSHMTVTGSGNDITIAAADDVVTTATDKYVTGGSASYAADPVSDPKGTATLMLSDGTKATVTGLLNTYVVSAETATDGTKATLTRNDGGTVDIDLHNTLMKAAADAAKADYKLVGAGTAYDEAYTVNNNSVALNVKNENGDVKTVTINDIASKTELDAVGLNVTGDNNTAGNVNLKTQKLAVNGTDGITTKAEGQRISIGLDAATASTIGSALQRFTVGGDSGSLTVDKDHGNFNILKGSDAVSTVADETTNTVKVDLAQTTKDDIQKGVDAETTVTTKGLTFIGNTGSTDAELLGSQMDIKGSDENIRTSAAGNAVLIALSKNLDITSLKAGNTTINTDGLTIGGGPSVTGEGIDAGGKVITNVADGVKENDAVNVGQLQNAVNKTVNKGVSYQGDVQASDAPSNPFTRQLGETTTINGGVTDEVKLSDKNIGVVSNGKDTLTVKLAKDLKGLNSVETKDAAGNMTVMNGTGTTVKDAAGNTTTTTSSGITINEGANLNPDGTVKDSAKTVSLTNGGLNNGGHAITNVADGVNTTDAVNVGQLTKTVREAVQDTVKKGVSYQGDVQASDAPSNPFTRQLGETATINGGVTDEAKLSDKNIGVVSNGKDTLTVKLAKNLKGLNSVETKDAAGNVTKIGGDGITITPADADKGSVSLTESGLDNGGNAITNVADGRIEAGSNDAVNGGQLKDVLETAGRWNIQTDSGAAAKSEVKRNDTVAFTGDKNISVTNDGNKVKVALKDTVIIGNDKKTAVTIDGTAGTIKAGKITLASSTDKAGNTRAEIKGLTNTRLTGETGVDGREGVAATEGQLRDVQGRVVTDMMRLDGRIDDVGAHAAAMAGLKPIQYDPLEPTQIMAAVGAYHRSVSIAIGVAHYTSEQTMIHAGASIGGADTMFNIGITRKFGSSAEKKAIPERYKAGPVSATYVLQDEVAALKAENAELRARNEAAERKYEEKTAALEGELAAIKVKLGL